MIRRALDADADAVFALVGRFATSFQPRRDAFDRIWPQLLGREDALLLVVEEEGRVAGYLLGFDHLALFANGPVAWVEELIVNQASRGRGCGRGLMAEFERWARSRQAQLIALATRRASGFYQALGYEESAAYFRKLL
jgi:GNAT superfamily N-acetyltransferase